MNETLSHSSASQPDERGWPIVRAGRRLGFADADDRIVIQPAFDRLSGFAEGLAVAAVEGLAGHIDRRGRFDDALPFSEWLAGVSIGSWGYIDRSGEFVIAPRYRFAYPFKNGFAMVLPKNRYMGVDRYGNLGKNYCKGRSKAGQRCRIVLDDLRRLLPSSPGSGLGRALASLDASGRAGA